MEREFTVEDNGLKFQQLSKGGIDGVQLTREEQQYLLPHFLMLLVGKPASGKTTLLRQLLTNPQMYHRKFDEILLVSPSYAKMDLKVKQQNTTSKFSLDWIFERLDQINEQQQEQVYGHAYGGMKLPKDKMSATGKTQIQSSQVLGDSRSRFHMGDIMNKMNRARDKLGFVEESIVKKNKKGKYQQEDDDSEYQLLQQQMFKDIQEMPYEEQKKTHVNVLLVLDDVVGSIKKAEYDPRLSRLIMNRRHLIFNGTLSIIIVTQKYTLIPIRLRSNANWLILYQLNPIDFENVYKDVIIHDYKMWQQLLKFVFGETYNIQGQGSEQNNEQQKDSTFEEFMKSKRFENLGIWVEFNVYFKNFKRINV